MGAETDLKTLGAELNLIDLPPQNTLRHQFGQTKAFTIHACWAHFVPNEPLGPGIDELRQQLQELPRITWDLLHVTRAPNAIPKLL